MTGDYDITPLHYACEAGHVGVIQALIDQYGARVDVVDDSGLTLLHNACTRGTLAVVEALIERFQGACSVEAVDDRGCTPLHRACGGGHVAVATALVEKYGANIEAVDINGETPLHKCSSTATGYFRNDSQHEGRVASIEMLVKNGANVEAVDAHGKTPLLSATSLKVVVALLAMCRANPNAATKDGDTPLHLCDTPEAAAAILKHGGNPNALNKVRRAPSECTIDAPRPDHLNSHEWTGY